MNVTLSPVEQEIKVYLVHTVRLGLQPIRSTQEFEDSCYDSGAGWDGKPATIWTLLFAQQKSEPRSWIRGICSQETILVFTVKRVGRRWARWVSRIGGVQGVFWRRYRGCR